jgi:two-component system, chemotaxis family, sensor kinase Cph1
MTSNGTTDEATAVEREFGEFSYIVSHDLAAVCRHLSQFSQLLVREVGVLTPAQQTLADHIHAAGDKCQAMMDQLLVFSRLQQRELRIVRADTKRLVDAALLQLGAETSAAQAEISLGGSLHATAVDSELMTLAFKHVLDNALKFRRPDEPARIAISTVPSALGSVARFSDQGIGLAPDLREKAFRMFWQLSAERGRPGVGSGLTIARRIARRHGGDVRFVDCADGACVEIDLPADNAAQAGD